MSPLHRKPFVVAGLCAGLVVGAARPGEASVPDGYGFGSRAAGMAGAVSADAVDFSASFYNPAGLVDAPGVSVGVGYMYNWQNLRVSGLDNEVGPVHGLVGGVVAPGVLFGVPFAFGIAVHLPDDGLSYINARRQGVPRWELYDSRAQLLYLSANLAVQPLEWLSIGGGIAYLSATRGTFGIRGEANVLDPFASALEHEVDADLTSVRFPQVGVRFQIEDWAAIGLTYRGESKLDLTLSAHLEGIVNFAGIDVPLLYELEAHTVAAFTPHQVALGLSFQKVEGLRLNLDLTWLHWSAYSSPTAEIGALLDVKPPPGTPLKLPRAPAPSKLVAPEFVDRVEPRFGAEYRIALGDERRSVDDRAPRPVVELPVRVGYAYQPSPVPDQSGETNLIDADRHTVTLGTGVSWNAPCDEIAGGLELDVHGAFSVLPERVVLKDNPADFVGDYRASGDIFSFGTTFGLGF
ncbi:MAG: outer membrane protein transport protein [Polyangiaceae bacterium]|nr:outer membrane protein transport protein [Polyangiaceae bacterium]